jgi:hypothetical protein
MRYQVMILPKSPGHAARMVASTESIGDASAVRDRHAATGERSYIIDTRPGSVLT